MSETAQQRIFRAAREVERRQSLPVGFQTPSERFFSRASSRGSNISRRRRGGGGGGQPVKVFESELLDRSFASAQARAQAELQFRIQQRKEAEEAARQQRIERINQEQLAERGFLQSQVDPSRDLNRFGGTEVSLPSQDPFSRARSSFRGRGEGLRVAGQFASPFITLGEVGTGFVRDPLTTSAAVGAGFVQTGKKVVTGEGFPEVGRFVREDPVGFTARIGGEVALLKGTSTGLRLGGRGLEVGRTVTSPKFRGVQTLETGEQVIKDIPKVGDLGLIPPGKGIARRGEPTLRGGFGFTKKEQAEFIGVEGVATSQRGLTNLRQNLLGKPVGILEIEQGFGLFGTPASPKTGRLQTRISRLGETPKEAGLSDILSGDFTFKQPKPEIILFPEETVGRRGGFQPFGKASSELEVTTKPPRLGGPQTFQITGQPGVTLINTRRVPIKTARLSTFADDIPVNVRGVGRRRTRTGKISSASSDLVDSTPVVPTGRLSTTSILGTAKGFRGSVVPKGFTRRTPGVVSPRVLDVPSFDPTGISPISPPVGVSRAVPRTSKVSPGVRSPLDLPKISPRPTKGLKFPVPEIAFESKITGITGTRTLKRQPSLIAGILDIRETGFGLPEEQTGLVVRGLKKPRKKRKR